MGVEQAIFTACESGITRSGAGLQIYSYSSGMEKILDTTDASILFQYEAPYERRTSYEEANAETKPRKYAYAVVEGNCPLVGFASNHAISMPREGSYFSHVLVTHLLNVTCYPCEYYKSPLFVEGLSDLHSDTKEKPEYLYKATRLITGKQITYESVRKFLKEEDRMEKLKALCGALLTGREGESQKKIVLIDENMGEENRVIYWIAAMTMVLPKQIARKVSFSDYEYEPFAAPYRICGTVLEGTRRTPQKGEEAYVFDFVRHSYPAISAEEELLDLFAVSFQVSKKCLSPFYEFIERYRYEACDEQLYAAYELYKMQENPDYIMRMPKSKLHQAVAFAEAYAKEEEKKRVLTYMLSFVDGNQKLEGEMLKEVLWYLTIQYEKGKIVKEKLYLPLLHMLCGRLMSEETKEAAYHVLKKEISYFFEQTGDQLARYYIGILPQKIHNFLARTTSGWKVVEVLSSLKEYLMAVKPSITEVAEDARLNQILLDLVGRTSSLCVAGKVMEMERIWQALQFDHRYATYLYLLMEQQQNIQLRGLYREYFWKLPEEKKKEALEYLILEREEALLLLLQKRYEELGDYQVWFAEMVVFIEGYEIYGGSLLDSILQLCFENAVNAREKRYEAMLQLFQYAFQIGYRDRFINRLIPYLSAGIPLVVAKEEQILLIKKLYYYQINFNGGMVERRVALCYRMYELKSFLESNPRKRQRIQFDKPVIVPVIESVEVSNYVRRAGRILGEIIFRTGQVGLIHDCYLLSKEKEQKLLGYIYETLLTKGRKKKDYMMFLHVFVYAMDETRGSLLAATITKSGAKVEAITDQMSRSMNHLIAYKKLVSRGESQGTEIAERWRNVIKSMIPPQ